MVLFKDLKSTLVNKFQMVVFSLESRLVILNSTLDMDSISSTACNSSDNVVTCLFCCVYQMSLNLCRIQAS